jgi:hypothetical protein
MPRLNLPCDILCLILDRLDYLSVRRFCQAVDCPPMDSYWRCRAAPHLFELDEIRHVDLDWRHLCLEIEKLRRSSETFWGRDRTLKILRHNKDACLRNLKKAQPLTPKDVINHIQFGVGRGSAPNCVFKYLCCGCYTCTLPSEFYSSPFQVSQFHPAHLITFIDLSRQAITSC